MTMTISQRRHRVFARSRLSLVFAVAALPLVVALVTAAEVESTAKPESSAEATVTLRFPKWPPMRVTKHLYQDNSGCATAKFDMWLQRGGYAYSLFMFESGPSERADHSTDENGTTVIIGGEGCRYRVRIDRAD